jgi:hypothetical protein
MFEPSIALLASVIVVVVGPIVIGFLLMALLMSAAFLGSVFALFKHGADDVFDETKFREEQADHGQPVPPSPGGLRHVS